MRKYLEVVLCVGATMVLMLGAEAADYSGGTGTENDPFQIGSAVDWITLCNTSSDQNKHFVLIKDIDFTGVSLVPLDQFSGVFDGNDHVIRHLIIISDNADSTGLIGTLKGDGKINNLNMENVAVTGRSYTGGLVGLNYGFVKSCYVSGTVTGSSTSPVGSLVGKNDGIVTLCYSTGTVHGDNQVGGLIGYNRGKVDLCYAASKVEASYNAGGLVGVNQGIVDLCYATSKVEAFEEVGGLVGYNGGTVTSSYSIGAITGQEHVGGLVGFNGKIVAYCYWDMQTSGQPSGYGGEGRTTDDMTYPHATNTYVDWDFETVWIADTDHSMNNGYPYLRGIPPTPGQGEGEGESEGEGEEEVDSEGEIEGEPVEGEVVGEGESSEGEMEGELIVEGEIVIEGELAEGEPVEGEGEGELPAEGEGEPPLEGEGEATAEGEGEGEGEPVEGEGEIVTEGETIQEGEGEVIEGEIVEGEGETEGENGTFGCCGSTGKSLSPKDLFDRTLGDWLVIGMTLMALTALTYFVKI